MLANPKDADVIGLGVLPGNQAEVLTAPRYL